MQNLELFRITKHDIIPVRAVTPEDVVLVLDRDSRNLYLYRGRYSMAIDEFGASLLYERIINRFLNPNIYLLKTLTEKSDDTPELIKIKEFIVDNYPNLAQFEFRRMLKQVFLLQGIRERIKAFKNYENSREWRSKVANTTNLWRLSWFNALAVFGVVLILVLKLILDINQDNYIFINNDNTFNATLWALWVENLGLTLSLCAFILIVVFAVNFLFILFPMRFPINPHAMQNFTPPKESAVKESERVEKSPPRQSQGVPALKLPKTTETTKGKMAIPAPKLTIDLSKKAPTKSEGDNQPLSVNDEFASDDLDIPAIPLKKKLSPKVTSSSIKIEGAEKLEAKDTAETKYIVIDCPICKENLIMPVPRKIITEAKEPVVDVSYVHGKPQHVLVAQIDHDYDVRRRRASWAVFEEVKK